MTLPRGAGPGRVTTDPEALAARESRLRALRTKTSLAVSTAVAPRDELSAMLAFVEDLARLAADLWLEGHLDDFATIEDPPDRDD